ncbi:hypothetical protein K437DRAFT_194881 [Tilletiaria anomala UBC 951]|uniref:DH domain-containing protein n=1 Tax=Tilletiaria anomala (strain ATCC 24038 / CBS 436.72 / UBC 951) TaxID=1037660 RepID=A0A066VHT3_TILAU|nr:uncharacterized protein K437DRAFT_194881 [Tilletiaria anomala UBC 951]KDN39828.1 hypothetical protein K437DRAFT_194881 [Tilletiaria anomala UBC 951]
MDPATAPPPAAGSSPGPGCPCSPRSPTVPLRSSSSRSSLHRALITAPSSSSPTRPAAATATATRTVAEPPLSDAISASPPFAAQPPPTRCLSPDTDTDTHCNSRPASGATTETSIEEVQEEGEGKGAAAAAACFHKDYVVPVHQVPLPSIPSPAISAAQALPRRFKRQSSSSMPAPALPPHAPSTAAADAPFPTASAATAATPTPPTSASAAGHEKRARKRSQRNSLVGLLSPSLASSLFAGLDAGGGATSRIASRTSITTISASKEWRERRQEKQRARVMSAGSGSGSGPAATCPSTGDAAVASGSSSPQTGAVALPLASGPDDSEMPQTHHYYQRSSSTHTVLPPPSATLTRRQMLGASSRRISLPTVPSMLHRSSLGSTIAAATAGGGAAAAAEAEEEEGEPDEERDSENPEIAAEPAPVRRRAAPAIPFGAAAANRTSMASIASFESLPEGHAVGSFAERSTVLVSGGLASGGSASGITKRRSVSREPSAESWLSLSAGGRARGCGFASASVLASGSAITDSPPSSPASPSMPDHEAPPPPAAAAAASRASHRSSSSSSSYSFAFGQAPSPLFTPGKARAALSQSVARPLSSSTAAVAAARMQRRALHRSSTEPAGGVGVGVVDLMALLQKRKNTAAELLDTERRYVAGLKMIHEVSPAVLGAHIACEAACVSLCFVTGD